LDGGGKAAIRTLRKSGGLSEEEIERAHGMAAGKPEIDTSMVYQLPKKRWIAR
jgi:hypothetical protein